MQRYLKGGIKKRNDCCCWQINAGHSGSSGARCSFIENSASVSRATLGYLIKSRFRDSLHREKCANYDAWTCSRFTTSLYLQARRERSFRARSIYMKNTKVPLMARSVLRACSSRTHRSFPQSRGGETGVRWRGSRGGAAFLNKRRNLILSLCLALSRSRGEALGARWNTRAKEERKEEKRRSRREEMKKRRDRVDDFPVFVRPPRDISAAGV